jgi:hypothetical protein
MTLDPLLEDRPENKNKKNILSPVLIMYEENSLNLRLSKSIVRHPNSSQEGCEGTWALNVPIELTQSSDIRPRVHKDLLTLICRSKEDIIHYTTSLETRSDERSMFEVLSLRVI